MGTHLTHTSQTPMNMQYLNEVAEFNVRKVWNEFAKQYIALKNHPVPSIKVCKRLKTTAGYAHYGPHMVQLCASLMWEHTSTFVNEVIPHEVGHLVANIVYNDHGHGKGWNTVMKHSGYKFSRLHNMINSEWESQKAANRASK